MTFGREMFDAVLAGRKTVTRRLRCPYRVGQDYAIQPGRGQFGVQGKRMLVTRVREELLAWVCDEAEARREGFESVDAFIAYWRAMNHGRWDPSTPVHRIEFRVIDA